MELGETLVEQLDFAVCGLTARPKKESLVKMNSQQNEQRQTLPKGRSS